MGFWQYTGNWVWSSFYYPWNILQIILGVAAIFFGTIAAKKPNWWRYMKNITWAWKVPLIIFVVILIPSLTISSYNTYENMYEKLNAENIKNQNDLNILASQILILHKRDAEPWSDRLPVHPRDYDILLSDNIPQIDDRIFNSCNFFANQNYVYFVNCKFVNCRTEGTTELVVLPINAMPNGTVVVFNNCVMRDCWFCDFTIIGNEDEIAYYKSNIIVR